MKEKSKAILLIAGGGGHLAQLNRLYKLLDLENKDINVILITEKSVSVKNKDLIKLYFDPLRDKYSVIKSAVLFPIILLKHVASSLKVFKTYDIKLCISTGPGVAIIPMFIGKLYRKKIIFIETWSRFYGLTITAKIVSLFSDIFYVQNKELLVHSKKAIYSGRL